MTHHEYLSSDFQRALREFKDQNQTQSELAKQAVACIRGETKDECNHPYTTNDYGWKICVTCGLYLRKNSVFLEMRNIIVIEQWLGKKIRRIDWWK